MADVRIKKVDFIEGYARKFNDFGQAMLNNIHQCSQMTSQYEDRLRELQKRIEDSCARIEENLKKATADLDRLYDTDDVHKFRIIFPEDQAWEPHSGNKDQPVHPSRYEGLK